MVIFDGITAVPRNRKLSEFHSKPFRWRENNSEFCSLKRKIGQTLGMLVRAITKKRKQLQNAVAESFKTSVRKTTFEVSCYFGCFAKLIFSRNAIPFRASELVLPRNWECLGMSTFFSRITETVPSLCRGIISERNSVPNSTPLFTSKYIHTSSQHFLFAHFKNSQLLWKLSTKASTKCINKISKIIKNIANKVLN